MTPEETGAALGPGWEFQATSVAGRPAWHEWLHGAVVVTHRLSVDDWVVGLGGDEEGLGCATPEAAVAAAHLLVAAERVAAGARVGGQGRWVDRFEVAPGYLRLRAPHDLWSAAAARSLALDLLRAADEAEAVHA